MTIAALPAAQRRSSSSPTTRRSTNPMFLHDLPSLSPAAEPTPAARILAPEKARRVRSSR